MPVQIFDDFDKYIQIKRKTIKIHTSRSYFKINSTFLLDKLKGNSKYIQKKNLRTRMEAYTDTLCINSIIIQENELNKCSFKKNSYLNYLLENLSLYFENVQSHA